MYRSVDNIPPVDLPWSSWIKYTPSYPALLRYSIILLSPSPSLSLLLLPLWSIGHPWTALFNSSFLILIQSTGFLGRGIGPSQGRYIHRTTQTQNKRTQISMPWAGFEHTIPLFERAKTVHALDRATTVIDYHFTIYIYVYLQGF
jgi:hypothetical protein